MMLIVKTRWPKTYNTLLFVIALGGSGYVLWKLLSEPSFEVDFKFIWLAGIVWAEGQDPYSSMYANAARDIFGGLATNVPQYWFYGPNWWPIARAMALFDLSTATQIWRLLIVAMAGLGSLLFCRKYTFLGGALSQLELAAFVGVVWLMQATAITISTGQTSAAVYLGFGALGLGLATSGQSLITSGVILLLLKPQIGLVLLPVLLILRVSRFAVLSAILITCIMAVPSLIGQDLVTMVGEFVAQAAAHGNQPSNLPLETTGLRHLLYSISGIMISSLSMTLLAGMLATLAAVFVRPKFLVDGKMTQGMLNAWLFSAIGLIGFAVTLHKYDLMFVAPLLLFSLNYGASVQLLAWLGFAIIFRSGNLAHVFVPENSGQELSISTFVDTIGVLLMFLGGVVALFRARESERGLGLKAPQAVE